VPILLQSCNITRWWVSRAFYCARFVPAQRLALMCFSGPERATVQVMRTVSPSEVSVVIPTWCSAAYVTRTLDTVAAQTVRGFEVVVSDDGSPDGTAALVEEYFARHPDLNGRVVRNEHGGPGATRNAGILAAKGIWIAFLDSDDLWRPEKLATVLGALGASPEANFACHSEEHIHVDGTVGILDYGAQYEPSIPLPRQMAARNLFSTSATMCRRDLLLASGGFDATLSSSQDYELWFRLSPQIRPVFVREVLGAYVDRPGNISSRKLARRILNQLRVLWRHRGLVGTTELLGVLARKAMRKLREGLRPTPGEVAAVG
jgi:glycosyltransferase involved in cell wall biosynthesis